MSTEVDNGQQTIFIKNMANKTFTLNVNPLTDNVEALYKKLLEKTDYDKNSFHLVFAGKPIDLSRNLILSEYGIRRQSTIFLVLRARGGIMKKYE